MPESLPAAAVSPGGAGVAVFDFDDTLIHGDSLPMMLLALRGVARVGLAVVPSVFRTTAEWAGDRMAEADWKGTVKAHFLRHLLAGVPVAAVAEAAGALRLRLRWRLAVRRALEDHAAAGRRVVVASGALDVWLPVLLEGLPVDEILATPAEVSAGCLTGRLAGPNCVRAAKASRLAPVLSAHPGPTWGYGNRPSDLPMLALMDHPTVVP